MNAPKIGSCDRLTGKTVSLISIFTRYFVPPVAAEIFDEIAIEIFPVWL